MLTDPIADMLTRIRNANLALHDTVDMPTLLNSLVSGGACIEVHYVHDHWRGVNDLEEFRHAVDFAHSQTPFAATPDAAAADRDA